MLPVGFAQRRRYIYMPRVLSARVGRVCLTQSGAFIEPQITRARDATGVDTRHSMNFDGIMTGVKNGLASPNNWATVANP